MSKTKSKKSLLVAISEIGKTVSVIRGKKIAFVTVAHDESAENPLEDCDGMGKILSFSNRHRNHIDPNSMSDEDGNIIDEYKDGVPLSYFEHGLCKWGVAGTMGNMPDFQWDGVGYAGVWIPDSCLMEEAKGLTGKKREEKMQEWAAQACEAYTAWCNGECYGYRVSAYNLRKADSGEPFDQESDYRHEKALVDDSCWGYIGDDLRNYMLPDCVAPILQSALGCAVTVSY